MSSSTGLSARLLGTGPSFPFTPDRRRGHLDLRSGPEKVRQAIELILRTEPGERVMRPSFGCPLRQFLMAPNTVTTRAGLERAVTRSLQAHEPRIDLLDVMATPGDDPALIHLTIRYRHRVDASDGLLVYPFYLEA